MIVGHHLITDNLVDDIDILSDVTALEVCFRRVFTLHRISVIDFRSHTFPGYGGVTGIFLLAESHASFHTWPEHRLMCSDVFACGGVDLTAVSQTIASELPGEPVRTQIVMRGGGNLLRDESSLDRTAQY